jgi:hypothetical protein
MYVCVYIYVCMYVCMYLCWFELLKMTLLHVVRNTEFVSKLFDWKRFEFLFVQS